MGHDCKWLPRSSDLTPLVWGYLKSKVFLTPPANLADLHQKITMEDTQILQDMIIQAMHNMKRRVELCICNNGGHIEGHFRLQAKQTRFVEKMSGSMDQHMCTGS